MDKDEEISYQEFVKAIEGKWSFTTILTLTTHSKFMINNRIHVEGILYFIVAGSKYSILANKAK